MFNFLTFVNTKKFICEIDEGIDLDFIFMLIWNGNPNSQRYDRNLPFLRIYLLEWRRVSTLA